MYSSAYMNPALFASSQFSGTNVFPWSQIQQQQIWPLLQQQFGQQPWTSQQWGIANTLLNAFACRAPSGIYGSHHVPATGVACAPGITSPVSPFSHTFGINPFSPVSGFGFHPDLAEIVKDLVIDRHRDVLQLETVHDLLDTRCHGRPLDVVIAELASGIPVPIPVILQILTQERALDHSADQIIRNVICDQVKNRKADEVIANILSGRRHLPRFDEEVEDWQNLLVDEAIVNQAAQVMMLAGCLAGVGCVNPITSPYRTKKHLMSLRHLATTGMSPLSGLANPLSQMTNVYANSVIPLAYGSVFPFVSSGSFGGAASLGLTPFRPTSESVNPLIRSIAAAQCGTQGVCPALPTVPYGAIGGLGASAHPIQSLLATKAQFANPLVNPLVYGASAVNPLAASQGLVNPLIHGTGAFNPLLASQGLTSPFIQGAGAFNPLAASQGLVNPLVNTLVQGAGAFNPLSGSQGLVNPLVNTFVQGAGAFNPLAASQGLINPLLGAHLAGPLGTSSFRSFMNPLMGNPMTSGLGNILRGSSAAAFPLSSLSTIMGGIQQQTPLWTGSSYANPSMLSGVNPLMANTAAMNPWMAGYGYPASAMQGMRPMASPLAAGCSW